MRRPLDRNVTEKAVEVAVGERNMKIRDPGGEASTQQVGKAVSELVATI